MVVLIQVKYGSEQKYVGVKEIEGQYDFQQFYEKVIEKFSLPPDAKLTFKDSTGTDVDGEIFSNLIHQTQGNPVLTVFSDDELSEFSFSSASDTSEASVSSNASTIILDDTPGKRPRVEETQDAAKQLIEAVLREMSGGEEVLQEYHATETLTDSTRRQLINILVFHMIKHHGDLPSKATRERYAQGTILVFPSLKDPYARKGYEHFYDPVHGTGYIPWLLKTVRRHKRQAAAKPLAHASPDHTSPGGPTVKRVVQVDLQLDEDACQEALSLLNYITDTDLIFQKMRETFQHRQKLVNDTTKSDDILSIFPRFLDTKGLVNQDFMLLFGDETSMRLQNWDVFFKQGIIREAKQLNLTPQLRCLIHSAQASSGNTLNEITTYDDEMASLLLLIHLLPPPPGGPKAPKISASDAIERLVVFHKSCCSLEKHLKNRKRHPPYILAVGPQKMMIDSYYIVVDSQLIPCQANSSLGAFDELFKAHFVFNLSYDSALENFYTFVQTTVFNIDVGKMKESPRVKELRAKLLNQTLKVVACE